MGSFQVKIVGDFCNLRCSYCRNRDFDQQTRVVMPVKTLEQFFRVTSALGQPTIRVSWHGGEPLLAGMNFFQQIIKLEDLYTNKNWQNCVQTNATLINDGWAQVFRDRHFGIGVSIDGSEDTHNLNRVNSDGHGTYCRAMRGVETLRKHNINPGVICTVTKKTVARGREVFLGLARAGFKKIAFNVFYNTASVHSADEYGLSDNEWLGFLIDVFESWLDYNDKSISIREIDGILAWTRNKVMSQCSFKGTCRNWFVIDQSGDIYPCERYGKEVCFGNINSIVSFSEITNSICFQDRLKITRELPRKCCLCQLQSLCHNGCTSHRQSNGDDVPIYTYCESRLGFYNYVCRQLGI